MTAVLLDVVPLALGEAVSRLLLLGQMHTLTAAGSRVRQSWAYVAGYALVVGGWALVALMAGNPTSLVLYLPVLLVNLMTLAPWMLHPVVLMLTEA